MPDPLCVGKHRVDLSLWLNTRSSNSCKSSRLLNSLFQHFELLKRLNKTLNQPPNGVGDGAFLPVFQRCVGWSNRSWFHCSFSGILRGQDPVCSLTFLLHNFKTSTSKHYISLFFPVLKLRYIIPLYACQGLINMITNSITLFMFKYYIKLFDISFRQYCL